MLMKRMLNRGLAALLLGSMALSLLASCQSSSAAADAPVRINEIMSLNTNTLQDEDGDSPDYIELHNTSDQPVSLQGYYLSDRDTNPRKWAFPDIEIAAGEYLVVFTSGKDRVNLDSRVLHTNFSISSEGGETILLMSEQHGIVDQIKMEASGPNLAYARVEDGSADNGQLRWFEHGTPGQKNDGRYAATQSELLTSITPVVISEYMTANDATLAAGDGGFYSWVELHNTSEEEVSLAGMGLSDSDSDPLRWTFPAQASIPAGGYLTVFLSGDAKVTESGELHAGFKLGSSDQVLLLSNSAGAALQRIELQGLTEGISCGTSPDDAAAWQFFRIPTPGKANTSAGYASLQEAVAAGNEGLWINEVAAVGTGSGSAEAYDWIELYNGSDEDIDLTGFGLSKKLEDRYAFTFPETTIEAGEYLLIYCPGAEGPEKEKKNSLYAPFKISTTGETLYLTNPDGLTLDVFTTGKLRGGVTSGRAAGGSLIERVFFSDPTPREENAQTTYTTYADKPTLSSSGGYASKGDSITVSAAPGVTVRYTTDGTEPTASSPEFPASGLGVIDTMTLHVRAFADGKLPSDTVSATYLTQKHDIPVVCLSTDPDNLFSTESGILVKGPGASSSFPYTGANFWKDWEREVAFEYFDVSGQKALDLRAGIKVFGQYSRAYDQKSLAVYFRDDYGQGDINYPFFENNDVTFMGSLVLRAGGQDQKFTRIRDAFCAQVMKGQCSNAIMDWQPVAVYLNGEYWGYFDLREKVNDQYFATHEGLDPDNLDRLKGNSTVQQGSNQEWKALLEYVKSHDLSIQENYDYVASQVDIENYIDYLIAEIFFANGDTGNIKFYRERTEGSKWRWVLFDLDMCLRNESLWDSYNMFEKMFNPDGHGSNNAFSTAMQRGLMENSGFKERFIERFAEHLNTTFQPERMLEILDGMVAKIDSEMKLHGARWDRPSYDDWLTEVDNLRRIVNRRRDFAKEQLIEYFDLSAARVEELFPAG